MWRQSCLRHLVGYASALDMLEELFRYVQDVEYQYSDGY